MHPQERHHTTLESLRLDLRSTLGCPLEADENANYADRGFTCIMPNYAHLQSVELCRIMLGVLQYAKIVLL